MTLLEMQTQLQVIEDKITEVTQSGEEYSITGSHSVKNGSIDDLISQKALLERRIFRYLGYTGRTLPTFSN